MKKILGITVFLLLAAGCTRENIWCDLVLQAQIPDGGKIVMMTVDPALDGNYLRNINTLETYDIPVFVNGTARVKVLKGLYVLAFDATAELESGQEKKVRFSGHTTEANAFSALEDEVTLPLTLIVLR